MFDDLAAYYHENVVDAFSDCLKASEIRKLGRSHDLRQVLNVATVLFHFREHLPPNLSITQQGVEKRCADYAIITDVANVAKHKVLNQKKRHRDLLIDNDSQLEEQFVLIKYTDADGTYWHNQKLVVAKLTNGEVRNLLDAITNVVNFWEQYLHSHGVLSAARTFTQSSDIRARSRTECESELLALECVRGRRFKQVVRAIRFNIQTGEISQFEDGTKLTSRIYKLPVLYLDIFLKRDADGVEYKKTIALSEEDSHAFRKLPNDDERQAYLNSLPAALEAFRELQTELGLTPQTIPISYSPSMDPQPRLGQFHVLDDII